MEPPPRPGLAYRVMLVLLGLGALKALATLALEREAFRAAFERSSPVLEVAGAALALGLLVAVVELWRLKPWALLLALVVCVLTFALDLAMGAPLVHDVAALVSTALLAAVTWPVRGHFAPFRRAA